MKAAGVWTVMGAGIIAFGMGGCAGAPPTGPAGPKAPVVQAQPEAPPAPKEAVLDPRVERRIVGDLLRDVREYHRLLQEKNVEQASAYVEPQRRAAFQDDLWVFVASYKIESADVVSYQLFDEPDGIMAKVKVVRTLFQKHSVVPEKSELWMTWHHTDDRWVLVPQKQK